MSKFQKSAYDLVNAKVPDGKVIYIESDEKKVDDVSTGARSGTAT